MSLAPPPPVGRDAAGSPAPELAPPLAFSAGDRGQRGETFVSGGTPPPVRWIVSPRYDFTFFIGSCVLTFLFYGIYRTAHNFGFVLRGDSILITYFLFTAFFDHPHILQTFSRTHMDKEEFARRRGLYTWGLAGFIGVGFIFLLLKWEAYLIVGGALYGTWHIIRQHYGFLKIYKALNDDRHPVDNWIDGLTYFTGMISCFFNDYSDTHGPVVVYGDLKVHAPKLPEDWGEAGWTFFLMLLTLMGFRQVWRAATGKRVNLPKLLLMASALGTHYFVFFATATPFLVAEALETVYHDVQYQGWTRRFQYQKFGEAIGDLKAGRRTVARWAFFAALYGLVVGVVEVYALLSPGSWAMWLFVPFTMVVIWHYYVDALIWRMRDDPGLRAMLSPAPATAQKT